MRLFIAITPPSAATAPLEALIAPLRSAWPWLRWTTTDSWHLTLAFLGEVPAAAVPELSARLERAGRRHSQLTLSVSGAGTFPSARRARVLWAGIGADRQALARLAASVAAGARRAGAPPPDEGRRLRPHLTLARCREPADLTAAVQALASFRGSSWQASRINLMQSYLGPSPRYEVVGSWPLGRAAEAAR